LWNTSKRAVSSFWRIPNDKIGLIFGRKLTLSIRCRLRWERQLIFPSWESVKSYHWTVSYILNSLDWEVLFFLDWNKQEGVYFALYQLL
jgi:hypothetical protein